ncbi:MAG: EAL domain-containing protein [Leucothrix sp.]
MRLPTLHSLIIGFSPEQHITLVKDLKLASASLYVNEKALAPDAFALLLKRGSVDIVFLKHNTKADFQPLYNRLQINNPDCIVVELTDPLSDVFSGVALQQSGVQTCQIVHDTQFAEFHLALQFVMQYVLLKKNFRRCKSLLYLSESRASKLVDSSNLAIAFIADGKIIHANIPFLVMFAAESLAELKRFSLKKIIAQDEYDVFINYLAGVNHSPRLSADLVLTLYRATGVPFNAKIQASQVVSKGRRCYQLWVEQCTQDYQEELIPVTKALNIWDMPTAHDQIEHNPFDHVLGKAIQVDSKTENSLDVLQRELLNDHQVTLRFRELYEPGKRSLKVFWAKLDIDPEDFRMINSLISRNTQNGAVLPLHAGFWDQLMFKLVLEMLKLEKLPERKYLVTLSANMLADAAMMDWLEKLLLLLEGKAKQLVLVIDSEMPMNRIPQIHKVIALLRRIGCHIALNNFSVEPTPLFLFKHIKPQQVILDSEWIDELKHKNDGGLFIKRFVQKLESRGVSVLIPQAQQKHQDRLFVLTGASFGQEIPTQDCA